LPLINSTDRHPPGKIPYSCNSNLYTKIIKELTTFIIGVTFAF
jgi:hypothetical protein